jgi:GT2 family glycosyltransferase
MERTGLNRQPSGAECPLVSVVILTYKRREALERTLDSVLTQEYPNREIIVVDTVSEVDVRGLIQARDPSVRLIELTENVGAAASRNPGIRAARGQIIVTIDDDVSFWSPFELTHIVKAFAEHPNIDVLVFQICDADSGALRLREWCHPKSWKEFGQSEFETYYLPEGAAAFRREVFDAVGLYYEPFFIGGEGGDFAFRLIDRGFRMLYCPRVRVSHLMSQQSRTPDRFFYFYTRNWIWLAYKDFHFYDGVRFLVPKLISMIYFTVRVGSYRFFLRGVRDGIQGLREVRRERTPIRKEAMKYIDELEKGRPGWLVRLARHREEPQI